jgi:tRNA pseudouridine38-40 synthase
VPTVQGKLEDALSRLLQREVVTTGAGRTDAGVHALAQVVSVPDVSTEVDAGRLKNALNKLCAPSIAVTAVNLVSDTFDARFSARSRTYVYAIFVSDTPDPFLARTALRHPGPLDVSAMQEAAGHLVGQHDFRSFGRVEDGATAERTLYELSVAQDGCLLRITARANAFIQQMVRSLVGTLLHVGEGKRTPGSMREILVAHDRSAAGPVAPPHGLCLVGVEYDEGWSAPLDLQGA